MLGKYKLLSASLATILASAVISYAVSARMPGGALPAGTTRYTVVKGATTATTSSTSMTDVPGLFTYVTIPAGKTGDVIVLFCGTTLTYSYAMVTAIIGGAQAWPGETMFRNSGGNAYQSQCVNFFRVGVPAGTRSVKIQWRSGDGSRRGCLSAA